jgi:hypothetical protein
MAPPSNTFAQYSAIGNREDLSDVIYNISPFDTPFMSSIASVDATAVLHEWQTDALDSASATNAVEEGLDASTDSVTATTRLTNRCQISDKVPRVTGTQQAVSKAGRSDELEYQISKSAKSLKTDMESSLLASNIKVTGASGTAAELGGITTWIVTNLSEGAGATTSTGAGANARTAGTNRVFTESQLKEVLRECWTSGGNPDCIMTGAFNKQKFSGFTGNATREVSANEKELFASIDVYDSDFGELQVFPNRFQVANDVLVLQKDMWAVAYLRPFQLHDLAKTGDSERRQLLVEYTLEARNEAASGAVLDLTSS